MSVQFVSWQVAPSFGSCEVIHLDDTEWDALYDQRVDFIILIFETTCEESLFHTVGDKYIVNTKMSLFKSYAGWNDIKRVVDWHNSLNMMRLVWNLLQRLLVQNFLLISISNVPEKMITP